MPRAATQHMTRDDDDTHPVQRRVPAGTTPITKPAGAMNSVFDTKGPKAGRPKGSQPLDPDAVVIKVGQPIPENRAGGRGTVYSRIWARMSVGDCCELPDRNAKSLVAWVRKAKAGEITVRRLNAKTTGCWRTA